MNCRNCCYFPCYKTTCNIGNKEGCDNFKSITSKEIDNIDKLIDKKVRNDANEKQSNVSIWKIRK